jgi:hypothetical protein
MNTNMNPLRQLAAATYIVASATVTPVARVMRGNGQTGQF